jgi:hypothetical protein
MFENSELTRPEFRMALVECGFELIDDPKHLGRMNPRNQDDWGTTTNEEEVRGQSNGERKESSAKSSIRNEYDSLHEKVSKIQKAKERARAIAYMESTCSLSS